MADAIAHYHTLEIDHDTPETERFVRIFDRFFDMLNTQCLEEGIQKIKPDLHPYRSPQDERFKVYNDFTCTCETYTLSGCKRTLWATYRSGKVVCKSGGEISHKRKGTRCN